MHTLTTIAVQQPTPCPWLFYLTGVFCCGPVPLKAIKEGELNLKYDAPFVFAEVNADVVEYVKLTNGRMVKMGGSSIDVGHFISTKAVGSDERHDITHLYKHPEGRSHVCRTHKIRLVFVNLC